MWDHLGEKIQQFSKQLIEANLVHFIASDAHNTTTRTFYMKEAYQQLEKEFSLKKVEVFQQTTKNLVNGEIVVSDIPKNIKKTKFLGLF